ncbi:MAG: DNA polymerase III subunit delta [candidate division KSB1 bacterium]|nr:DNA polymerase III subunit delta [candidate division KSB1 bacterium]
MEEVQAGRFNPVYFFAGEETGFIDEGVELLLSKLVTPEIRDFNLDVFYGSDVTATRVIDRATSFPLMASHRVILVRDVQKMPTGDLEALVTYAKNPSRTTYLIMTMRDRESRKKSITALRNASAHVECRPLYENQIVPWIQKYVRQLGNDITDTAAQLLASEIGASTSLLRSEIEKILLYSGARQTDARMVISEEEVQAVVGFRKEYSIFALQDAVGAKDIASALHILDHLLPNTSAGAIISSLARYFGNLHLAHGLPARRDQAQLAERAGVHTFFAERLQRAAKNYNAHEIFNALEILLHTDYLLKTQGIAETLALRLMLIAIVRCLSPKYLFAKER